MVDYIFLFDFFIFIIKFENNLYYDTFIIVIGWLNFKPF